MHFRDSGEYLVPQIRCNIYTHMNTMHAYHAIEFNKASNIIISKHFLSYVIFVATFLLIYRVYRILPTSMDIIAAVSSNFERSYLYITLSILMRPEIQKI